MALKYGSVFHSPHLVDIVLAGQKEVENVLGRVPECLEHVFKMP